MSGICCQAHFKWIKCVSVERFRKSYKDITRMQTEALPDTWHLDPISSFGACAIKIEHFYWLVKRFQFVAFSQEPLEAMHIDMIMLYLWRETIHHKLYATRSTRSAKVVAISSWYIGKKNPPHTASHNKFTIQTAHFEEVLCLIYICCDNSNT